jgi:hypothetical protein
MISPLPCPMGMYDGTLRIGEIIDHGKGCVIASDAAGKPIGRFPDRKSAMKAVSAAYSKRKDAASSAMPPDGAEVV